MAVKTIQITVLIEDTNNSIKSGLKSKHGLSFYIQTKIGDNGKVTVLMDTGPSSDALLYNVDLLGVNLEEVDIVVLSHGHYDHTGGLLEALKKIRKRVPVIVHPTLFEPKLRLMPHLKSIGTPFRVSDVESAGGVPLLLTEPMRIADGVTTTGEVPRTTEFERVTGFGTILKGRFANDVMIDDQSIVVAVEDKGLIVVTGCAHSGIINTIKYAQKITKNNTVYAVLGGFHLVTADAGRIQSTVDELEKLNIEFVGPCHCTGKDATKKFGDVFGDNCRPLHSGDAVKI